MKNLNLFIQAKNTNIVVANDVGFSIIVGDDSGY